MDTSRISTYSTRQHVGISPQKSKEFDISLTRNHDNKKSEKAAHWAIFNTVVASILYYDLCYIQILDNISDLLIYVEWLICAIFTLSACYDIFIHLWLINLNDYHQYNKDNITNDHHNSVISNTPLPPFEILHLYDEEERVITTQQADLSSPDNSMNRSRRSQVTDKESLAEYLREVQEKELYASGS